MSIKGLKEALAKKRAQQNPDTKTTNGAETAEEATFCRLRYATQIEFKFD